MEARFRPLFPVPLTVGRPVTMSDAQNGLFANALRIALKDARQEVPESGLRYGPP